MDIYQFTPYLLNLSIVLVFLFSIFEDRIKPQLTIFNRDNKNSIHLSFKVIVFLLIVLFPITLLFLLNAASNMINLLVYLLFSICIMLHAMWISFPFPRPYRLLVYLFAAGIILLRYFSNSIVVHDIYIALVVTWLGPFIASIQNFLSRRVFIGISLVWFLYDMMYVWITGAVDQVRITTSFFQTLPANFSLSLMVLGESIGIADLFFAVLLLAFLHQLRTKLIAIALFIASNVALEIYAYITNNYSTFPLLVLWVPLGFMVFLFEKRKSIPNSKTSIASS